MTSIATQPTRIGVTQELAQTALRVRMVGSAAIDLVWVADGRTDACLMLSNRPWDVSAGVIIAREAGACVVDYDGSDHTVGSSASIAASPGLISEVVSVVRRAGGSPGGTCAPGRPALRADLPVIPSG